MEALEALADLERQRASMGGEAFFPDPTELVCQLWDDTGLSTFFKRGVVFAPGLDAAFMELRALHAKVDFKESLSGVLADPHWQQAAHVARKIAAILRDTPVLPNPKFQLE